jgi:hypothetical protein
MKYFLIRTLLLLIGAFSIFTTNAGECYVTGEIIATDGASSTRVSVETVVVGRTDICTEPDGSFGSWDIEFATVEAFLGAEPLVIDRRVYVNQWDSELNHEINTNILQVSVDVTLPENEWPLFCFRGTHGMYRFSDNLAKRGDDSLFCGDLGHYQTTSGGGGTGPCPDAVTTPNATATMIPTCDPDYDDPLLIDLGQDGIHLGQAGTGVWFDMNADGEQSKLQWVQVNGNEAFLALDLNYNGNIDSGAELFGTSTYINTSNTIATNGFIALAQYDYINQGGNEDGIISSADNVWSKLILWLDHNADALSTSDELIELNSIGITQLSITPKFNGRQDSAGNLLPFWSWAWDENINGNNKYKMVDVFFKPLAEN